MAPSVEDGYILSRFSSQPLPSFCSVCTVGGWPGLPFCSAQLLHEISTISGTITQPAVIFLQPLCPLQLA